MAKTSRAKQLAQDVIDDDTAVEARHAKRLRRIRQLGFAVAADGVVTLEEFGELLAEVDVTVDEAEESLDRNRLAAGLLCLDGGGVDPWSDKAARRLPCLPDLLARFVPAEDAEPEDLVA